MLENVLAGRHCRMRAGLFACMLHTPGQRREEKAAVARAWRNCASWAWPTAARKPPEACPTAINGCWKSRALWLRTRACWSWHEPAGGMNDQETAALVDIIGAIPGAGDHRAAY